MTGYLIFVFIMTVIGLCLAVTHSKEGIGGCTVAFFFLCLMTLVMICVNFRYGGIVWLTENEYKLIQQMRKGAK